jgi:hypothetical protein
MDDLIQFLIFAAVAIFYVASTVSKQKKKTAAKKMNSKQEQFINEEFSSEEFFMGNINSKEKFVSESQNFENKKNDIIFENKQTGNNDIVFEEGINAIPDTEDNNYQEDTIEREYFDLRNAIIYSEILNRKTL